MTNARLGNKKPKLDPMDYLGVDFYHVETDPRTGKKVIHDNGYFYESQDDGEGAYRSVEYAGLYLDPERLRYDPDYYDGEQQIVIQYIEPMDKGKAIKGLAGLIRGSKPLLMTDVRQGTPNGWYRDSLDNSKPRLKLIQRLTRKI